MSYGTLTAIGLGPGDPELITLKGRRLLRAAGVVFVPTRAAGADSFALELAWPHLDLGRQEIVPLVYPMPRGGPPDPEQWRFNAGQIAARLADGTEGAFVVEGDPLLYSSFASTLLALQEEYPALPVQIVPGVSSITAAAACAQVSLARLDERLAVLPATAGAQALRQALAEYETVVILKPSAAFEQVLDVLEESGRLEQALLAERVGTACERLERDVRALRGRRPDYFSLLLVRRG